MTGTIGLDIGSTGVRGVQTVIRNGKPRVIRVAEVPLGPGAVAEGDVKQQEQVVEALKELWQTAGFRTRRCVVSLSGLNQPLVRNAEHPWEPEDTFRDALPHRMADDITVPGSEMVFDFHPLRQVVKGRDGAKVVYQRALVIAAMRANVENLSFALKEAGLKPSRIDFAPFALIRAAAYAKGNGAKVHGPREPGEEYGCEAIIDVGARLTTVVIHDAGRPMFIHRQLAGSEAITLALTGQLGITQDVADAVKRSLGLQGIADNDVDSASLRGQFPDSKIPHAEYIVNSMANGLVQAARKTIEGSMARVGSDAHLERILVSGGGALIPGYVQRLQADLGAPAEILDPVNLFSKQQTGIEPRMVTAFGLSLGVKK